MNPVMIRIGVPYYVVLLLCIVPTGWAMIGNALYYLSHGYFKTGTASFFGLLAGVLLLLFTALRVAPAYRVVLSDEGVSMTHRVSVFGFKLFDASGSASWYDVLGLDTHSIGWVWGLALFFEVDGKLKTVWLNRTFTSKKEALRFVVSKLPARKISEKARKKLVRMGILAAD